MVKTVRNFNLSTPSMSAQHGAYTWDKHNFLFYHKCEVFTVFKSAVHTTVCKYNTTLNRSDKNNNEKQKWDLMNVQAIKYVSSQYVAQKKTNTNTAI